MFFDVGGFLDLDTEVRDSFLEFSSSVSVSSNSSLASFVSVDLGSEHESLLGLNLFSDCYSLYF